MITLRNYQKDAYKALNEALREDDATAVVMPEGTGKHTLILKFIEDNPSAKICVITEYEKSSELFLGHENVVSVTRKAFNKMSAFDIFSFDFVFTYGYRCLNHLQLRNPFLRPLGFKLVMFVCTASVGCSSWRNYLYIKSHICYELPFIDAVAKDAISDFDYVVANTKLPDIIDTKRIVLQAVPDSDEKTSIIEELNSLYAMAKKSDVSAILEKHLPDKSGRYLICFDDNQDGISAKNAFIATCRKQYHVRTYTLSSARPTKTNCKLLDKFHADNSNNMKLLLCRGGLDEGLNLRDLNGVIFLSAIESHDSLCEQLAPALRSNNTNTKPVVIELTADLNGSASLSKWEFSKITSAQGKHVNSIDYRIDISDISSKVTHLSDSYIYVNTLERLETYYKEHNTVNVPRNYVTEYGYPLGVRLNSLRIAYARGFVAKSIVDKLNAMGFSWDVTR